MSVEALTNLNIFEHLLNSAILIAAFIIISRFLKNSSPYLSIALEGTALWGALNIPLFIFEPISTRYPVYIWVILALVTGLISGIYVGYRAGKDDASWCGFLSIFTIFAYLILYFYLIFIGETIYGIIFEGRTGTVPEFISMLGFLLFGSLSVFIPHFAYYTVTVLSSLTGSYTARFFPHFKLRSENNEPIPGN